MLGTSDKREVAEIFRERMTMVIDQRHQSLSAFASSVGLDRSALSQFLAPGSTRLPRAETLHAISRACGVSLDWLLGLIASDENNSEQAPMLELQTIDNQLNNSLLSQWHKEATGYKIRYVPSALPDLLRTEAVSQWEFSSFSKDELIAKENASKEQLNYLRKPETDMEVCMPLQRLEGFAKGEGFWKDLPVEVRREQLQAIIQLTDEMYPTFRLFLYDGRKRHASPYTVFGPKKAAIYLGDMYMVVNSAEHIKSLTHHFDQLIRFAVIGPDRIAGHVVKLLKTIDNAA